MSAEIPNIDYNAVLADLRARRAQLDNAIAVIEAVVSGQPIIAGGGALQAASSAIAANSEILPDTFFSLTIADAVKKYLNMRKRMTSTAEIVEALRRGGMRSSSSENFANSVAAGLSRNYADGGGIVRVQRGMWGLAEWYPNKPRKPSASKETSDDDS